MEFFMEAAYPDSIPYNHTVVKRIALPKENPVDRKTGYGNLVFLFTDDYMKSIRLVNNKTNCYHDNKYTYFYYNLLYRGVLGNTRYNIKDVKEREDVYEKVKKLTTLTPHPPTMLDKTPNRNTYFDMSKYFQIFKSITEKYYTGRKVSLFWSYFPSIWNSPQCAQYDRKIVLIDADMYDKFSGNLHEDLCNPIFMIYYALYKRFELIKPINIDFLIVCKGSILKINPSMCTEKDYNVIRAQLTKLFNRKTGFETMDDASIDFAVRKEHIKDAIRSKYNFTGEEDTPAEVTSLSDQVKEDKTKPKSKVDTQKIKVEDKLNQKIDQEVNKAEADLKKAGAVGTSIASREYIQTKAEMDIQDDKEIIDDMYKLMQMQKVPTKPLSTARDAKMRARQESLTLGSMSFSKINSMNSSKKVIPKKDISSSIHNLNKNAKYVKFANMNKDYIEHVMPQDIAKVFTSLNDKSVKFYVRDIEVKDSSNELNYKETWHVTLEDEQGQRHSITVDIPKFLDNKFMYLGGNKKIINRQNFLYPVVKTAPDTVQIVSNYNKMFIRRIGTKSISTVERLMKLISNSDECQTFFTVGNNSTINRAFLTTIEYDEFGKVLTQFKTKNTTIFFNQKDATEYAEKQNIEIPEGKIFIGIQDKNPVFIDSDTQVTAEGQSICDLIVSELPENLQKEFNKTRSTKKLMYNTATIMSQSIPFIVLLMYWEGVTSVFNKMNLKYYFSARYPSSVKPNEAVVRFRDSYFVYETNLQIDLLMNGLKVLDTENHDMEEYNTTEPYIEYFRKVYGKTGIVSAISNYYDFMIDPITKEILEDINLPTDLVELCIYASNLLTDESYTPENSQTLARVRSVEIIPAILYYELSKTYLNYKNKVGKEKLSIPKDAVIKQLLALQTVEDYSTLNPVVELEKDRAITSKGYRGINMERAYTEEKRSYDESMIGVMAMNTSPDGNVGINRFLTMEPTITTARGYVDIKKDERNELVDANLFSPGELLFPLGNTRDDSIRTAMATKQSKHVIPMKHASPTLMSNGFDESIKYNLSSDFCVNAEEDGTVIDYDATSKVMIIEYKSGKHKAVDLSSHIVKNGGGGFYLSNELVTELKVGDKVKKDQPIAWHKDFFKNDAFNGVRMNVGVLEKVAIMSSYDTYNDATVITQKLAHDAESDMVFCKPVVIGKNSNIYEIRNVGDHVEIGDSLLSFDVSFEDSDLNKMLASLSDQERGILEEGSINQIKSKYAGEIVDIKIYSTVDLEELSPSLQKVVGAYYKKINHKKQFVSKYDKTEGIVKCGLLLNETTGKVEPNIYGVIKGQKVQDSVLIEFYISHADIMGVGDKLAYFTALKSIVSEVIPEGYEPYSEFRPDEEVSSLIGPSAILKRQVPSITLTLLGNKVIVELKRKLEEIYNS